MNYCMREVCILVIILPTHAPWSESNTLEKVLDNAKRSSVLRHTVYKFRLPDKCQISFYGKF